MQGHILMDNLGEVWAAKASNGRLATIVGFMGSLLHNRGRQDRVGWAAVQPPLSGRST